MTHTLRFLGTGAASGVPSFYCGCKACEEALQNPAVRRTCAGLLISGQEHTLIDASPDLRMQLSFARIKNIDRVLFTHEHFDHVGGIPQLEFYVRLQAKEPLPLYAGAHTLTAITEQFAFMADTLKPHEIEAGQSLILDKLRYTALPAQHGTQTYGFLIEKAHDDKKGESKKLNGVADNKDEGLGARASSKRVAYFPDTGPLSNEVCERIEDIDVLIIDATFNKRNWMPASHLTIDEAICFAKQVKAKKTFLTHLALHYDEPITAQELQAKLAPYEGTILAANDGLELPI